MHSHRLLFTKEGPARYISHLDLMRTFPRAFLRAGISLKHTEGFHPHAAISIALPLPIGFSSACELLDFTPEEEVNPETLPELLGRALPEGIRPIRCSMNPPSLKNLVFVGYRLSLEYDSGIPEDAEDKLRALFQRDSLIVPKKAKPTKGNHTGTVETDIRLLLRTVSVSRSGESFLLLDAVVTARDPGLNPSLIVSAIQKHCPEAAPDFVSYHRNALYDGQLRPFSEISV